MAGDVFRIVYDGKPLDLAIESSELYVRAASGRWKGQEFEDDGLWIYIFVGAREFTLERPDHDHDGLKLKPGLHTEWLTVPIGAFESRNYRALEKIAVRFEGLGTLDALRGEDWTEPPGGVVVYVDEGMATASIDFKHLGGDRFRIDVAGTSEQGSSFELSTSAALGVEMTAHRNSADQAEVRRFFERSFDADDFDVEMSVSGDTVLLKAKPKVG